MSSRRTAWSKSKTHGVQGYSERVSLFAFSRGLALGLRDRRALERKAILENRYRYTTREGKLTTSTFLSLDREEGDGQGLLYGSWGAGRRKKPSSWSL